MHKFKKIIQDFVPKVGYHCVTCSLKQIFQFNKKNVSEDMLFGLASGLGFYSLNEDDSDYPSIGGRILIGKFEENLSELLNIKISITQSSDKKEAYEHLKQAIIHNRPSLVYVDMHYLPYLDLPDEYHFGAHNIIVYGLDEEADKAYISDTDSKGFDISLARNVYATDFHLISLKDLADARSSKHKPYPPNNKMLTFDFSEMKEIETDVIFSAIVRNMSKYLFMDSNNLALMGLRQFGLHFDIWKKLKSKALKSFAFEAFMIINQVGGGGGGFYRRMYSRFLREAAAFTGEQHLNSFAEEFAALADEWDFIGNEFYKTSYSLNRDHFDAIKDMLLIMSDKEEPLCRKLLAFAEDRIKNRVV